MTMDMRERTISAPMENGWMQGMRMYYTVYDARTDDVLAFGNAAQCAVMLGCASSQTFHSIVSKVQHGKHKKYSVVVEDLDKEVEERP
jgi:hypothetical protein